MAIKEIVFHWDDRLGVCEECGYPAAFLNSIDQKLCSVCAANQASEGDIITRIESLD